MLHLQNKQKARLISLPLPTSNSILHLIIASLHQLNSNVSQLTLNNLCICSSVSLSLSFSITLPCNHSLKYVNLRLYYTLSNILKMHQPRTTMCTVQMKIQMNGLESVHHLSRVSTVPTMYQRRYLNIFMRMGSHSCKLQLTCISIQFVIQCSLNE